MFVRGLSTPTGLFI